MICLKKTAVNFWIVWWIMQWTFYLKRYLVKKNNTAKVFLDSSLFENKLNSWNEKQPSFNLKQDIANNILNSNITICDTTHALIKLNQDK